ncbi:MAG: Cu(I)-responsive transcriptional regulator [Polyangiaceae bacterium]
MKIGEVAESSGVPAKTIRYYEEVGLLPEPERADNGYRAYERQSVELLRFIARARGLGFSLDDVRDLVDLWQDKDRASADVRRLAKDQIAAIDEKLAELQSMRRTLSTLVERCHGDDRPDCPILDELAAEGRSR